MSVGVMLGKRLKRSLGDSRHGFEGYLLSAPAQRENPLLLESMCGIRESLGEMTESEQFDTVFKMIIYGHIELRNLNSH